MENQKPNKGIAMVISLFFPGVGHLYKGKLFECLAWMVFVLVGYVCLIIPGLVLHLLCIISAGSDTL